MNSVIAVDLGASSGRVMVGTLHDGKVALEEFHRFENKQIISNNSSCWDLPNIVEQIKIGIDKVLLSDFYISGIGVDTWGVDFVLLDENGAALGDYVSYRDARTLGVMDAFLAGSGLTDQSIYQLTGIQFLTFNSLYQLKAVSNQRPVWFDQIRTLLFIPDYLNFLLCGVKHCEYTNASTSQMLGCNSKAWSQELIQACGAHPDWFLPPQMPNQVIGNYQVSNGTIPVISVASHDTASAVAATPLQGQFSAYISSGTWSLVGVESMTPCNNDKAFTYNITNEGGVDGRYRVLKNIMGLWLIQRVRAEQVDLCFSELIAMAKDAKPFQFIMNPNDGLFLNPPSMTIAIQTWFESRSLPAPQTLTEVVRCIYDSLALAYAESIEQLSDALGYAISDLCIVGGGSQDHFLNQLCADVCQIPVATEPTEASALGNVINQFITLGEIENLDQGRMIIENSSAVKHFTPNLISGLHDIKAQYLVIKQTVSNN
jgi:rhamnulokinase